MDSGILNNLVDLFRRNKHNEILTICELNKERHPNDIEFLYCAAMAALMSGNPQKGFSFFQELLNVYNIFAAKSEMDRNVMLFVGVSALQMAEFSEYQQTENRSIIFDIGVSQAINIAQKAGHKQLEIMADKLGRRIKKTIGGEPYVIPKSPTVLQIEPTNQCNLKCTMCPRSSMTRERGFINISLLKDIIHGWSNKVVEHTGTHLVYNMPFKVVYPGGIIKCYFMGEPLLHPKFDLLIKVAKEAGCRIGIQTNGVLLHNSDIRSRLLKSSPDGFAISLDGIDGTVYDNIRKGSNWDRICQSIKCLYEERKEMGLESAMPIDVSTIVTEGTDENHGLALTFLDRIRPYINNINAITLTRSYNPFFFNQDGDIEQYEKKPCSSSPLNKPLCDEPLEKLNILWDGTVSPCCYDIDGQFILGDVNKNSIDDIWQSDQVKSLHHALMTHDIQDFPLCKACKG